MEAISLMNNPYAWLFLAFCTVAAFVFAIYTWIAGKKKKEFSYFSNSYKIIQKGKSSIPQLQLTYENRNIEDLSITKYAIWNSGNEVINTNDIVSERPLKITASSGAVILNTKVIVESEETNKFIIDEQQENSSTINFDYVDPRDGIVIQIIHTGENLEFDGKIKGGKKFKNLNKKGNSKKISRKAARKIMTILLCIEGILITVMTCFVSLLSWGVIPKELFNVSKSVDDVKIIDKALSVIMIIMVIFLIYTLYDRVKRIHYINIPVKLRQKIEYEDFEN